MNSYKLDLEKYAALARQAVAEGCVLLENEGQALPLRDGERVAVFGRMAFHYYKSGLGSGGLVNTRYVVGILDALKECEGVHLDEKLMGIYEDWIMENPYDEGQGWTVRAGMMFLWLLLAGLRVRIRIIMQRLAVIA